MREFDEFLRRSKNIQIFNQYEQNLQWIYVEGSLRENVAHDQHAFIVRTCELLRDFLIDVKSTKFS